MDSMTYSIAIGTSDGTPCVFIEMVQWNVKMTMACTPAEAQTFACGILDAAVAVELDTHPLTHHVSSESAQAASEELAERDRTCPHGMHFDGHWCEECNNGCG